VKGGIDLLDLSAYLDLRAGFGALPQPARLYAWPKDRRTGNHWGSGRWVAAVFLGFCLAAISVGWWRHASWRATDRELESLFQDATIADLVYASRPVLESESRGIQQRLSARLPAVLGIRVKTPDLSAIGFRLVGALEFVTARAPAVLLVYRDDRGREVSCYFRRAQVDNESGFRRGQLAGAKVIYRLTDRFAYAVLGSLQPGELRLIAEAAYAQTGIDSEQ
jgi:anti-sigma factor RsiW